MMAPYRGTELNQTPNANVVYSGVSVWVMLSGKGCGVVKTARRLA